LLILDQVPDDINAEAVDTAPQPETHHVVDRFPDRRVAPVEIRLLAQERVIVVLPGGGIILPGAAAELRKPVVGRTAVRFRIAPEIPVPLWVLPRAAAFDKPRVL